MKKEIPFTKDELNKAKKAKKYLLQGPYATFSENSRQSAYLNTLAVKYAVSNQDIWDSIP